MPKSKEKRKQKSKKRNREKRKKRREQKQKAQLTAAPEQIPNTDSADMVRLLFNDALNRGLHEIRKEQTKAGTAAARLQRGRSPSPARSSSYSSVSSARSYRGSSRASSRGSSRARSPQ